MPPIHEKHKSLVNEYLLRIVHRYFDTENLYTESSIESIVVESLRRLKETLDLDISHVFMINNKSGIVSLTFKDIGAEAVFSKQTAYNKSFGKEIDTIIDGDSIELSNERIPISHDHLYNNISSLKEQLDKNQKELEKVVLHTHDMIPSTLYMLKYTGTMTAIDLILIETLESHANFAMSTLNNYAISSKEEWTKQIKETLSLRDGLLSKIDSVKKDVLFTLNNYAALIQELNIANIQKTKDAFDAVLKSYVATSHINKVTEQLRDRSKTVFIKKSLPIIEESSVYLIDKKRSIVTNENKHYVDASIESIPINEYSMKSYIIDSDDNRIKLPIVMVMPTGETIIITSCLRKESNGKVSITLKTMIVQNYDIDLKPNMFYGNKLYYFSKTPDSWVNHVCEAEYVNASLVIILNKNVDNFLYQAIQKENLPDPDIYWTAGAYIRDRWQIVTDSGLMWENVNPSMTYIPDETLLNQEDYQVAYIMGATGKWHTTDCLSDDTGYGIYEWKIKRMNDFYKSPKFVYEIYKEIGGIKHD